MSDKGSARRKIVSQSVQEADQQESNMNETAEASENGKKKRGRPKGVPVGPRPRYFIGSAMKGDKLVMESVLAFSEEEAHKAFKDKCKVAAQHLMGPVSFFVGDQRQAQIKRVTVSLKSTREALTNRTGKQIECIFEGWRCIGSGVGSTTGKDGEQYQADTLYKLDPFEPVNPEDKPKKIRLAPDEVVRADALTEIKEIAA